MARTSPKNKAAARADSVVVEKAKAAAKGVKETAQGLSTLVPGVTLRAGLERAREALRKAVRR